MEFSNLEVCDLKHDGSSGRLPFFQECMPNGDCGSSFGLLHDNAPALLSCAILSTASLQALKTQCRHSITWPLTRSPCCALLYKTQGRPVSLSSACRPAESHYLPATAHICWTAKEQFHRHMSQLSIASDSPWRPACRHYQIDFLDPTVAMLGLLCFQAMWLANIRGLQWMPLAKS